MNGLRENLAPTSTDEVMPLSEVIANYRHLFGVNGPIPIEKLLLESFSEKEFEAVGLKAYFPKMYRGLPRIYHRDHPAQSHIKKNFSHLPTLKWTACEKAIFSLYEGFRPQGKMILFTWVIRDGWGDYTAALTALEIIQEKFPKLDLTLVALMPSAMQRVGHETGRVVPIPYEEEMGIELFPEEILLEMGEADVILQLPTFYPYFEELKERLPGPKWIHLGEYGFLESSWFHPKTGRPCMGLHFLEKGILIRKSEVPEKIESPILRRWLEEREKENRLYLAYLTTPVGGAVYLHALLKALEKEERGIDLVCPDLGWFIGYVEKQNEAKRGVIEGSFGVATLEVIFQERVHRITLDSKGKKVTIFCPGAIGNGDFLNLLNRSDEFVAVRGNRSFSEAVVAGKPFFYDGREHARYWIKDVLALAENRIADHPSALTCFRAMAKTFLHHLPTPEETWVDETYFQEREEWIEIAMEMGRALEQPKTAEGFRKWNQIVVQEASCNTFLCHHVQRAFCHRQFPELEREEQSLFFTQTFGVFIQKLRKLLAK